VSYHILYLCSGEEHLSGGPQEDHTRMDPSIWQLSFSLKRFDKYTLKLTFISGRIKQERQAKYTKSITKFFDHIKTIVREAYKPEISRHHDGLATERKNKIANGSHLSARSC